MNNEKLFNLATLKVAKLYNKLDHEILLKLYGFYKLVTIGNNIKPQPKIESLREQAKWIAWTSVNNISKTTAMIEYIALVNTF
jgi:acyl-CoA-binding protein